VAFSDCFQAQKWAGRGPPGPIASAAYGNRYSGNAAYSAKLCILNERRVSSYRYIQYTDMVVFPKGNHLNVFLVSTHVQNNRGDVKHRRLYTDVFLQNDSCAEFSNIIYSLIRKNLRLA